MVHRSGRQVLEYCSLARAATPRTEIFLLPYSETLAILLKYFADEKTRKNVAALQLRLRIVMLPLATPRETVETLLQGNSEQQQDAPATG
jgi:hypothetical protein